MVMYYLIHEYAGWSHSKTLEESDDLDALQKKYLHYVADTMKETDSTTDALYIEDGEGEVLICTNFFNEKHND